MKNNYYLIVILLVVVIGILACVLTQNVGTTETIGNTENTFATTNTNTNTNTNTQNVTNTTEENENTTSENNTTNVESQNVTEVVEQPVTNNQIYESDSDIGTTDKKQEAINLVKDVWGEDNTEKKIETENENFEELIEKLEAITNKLENDKLSLDESVALFEEGMKLSKKCNTKLEEAEKKITMLINENGEISEEKFGEN